MDRYRKFYNDHGQKLFNYLMRMTGDYELSRDLMQESFTRYLEHYRAKPQSVSLLFMIARNALLDHLRRRERHYQAAPYEEKRDPSKDQEEKFLAREEYQRVLSAIGHLENIERDILSLVVSGNLSYKEIGAITGMSEANVKVKVHRARLKLKEILYNGGT